MDKQRIYQREWARRKRMGLPTKLYNKPRLSKEQLKKNKIITCKKYDTRIRKERDDVFGKECKLCGFKNGKLNLHRKNGIPHKTDITTYRNAIANKQDWIKLCGKCHTGVHFNMNVLKLNWDKIYNLFKNA